MYLGLAQFEDRVRAGWEAGRIAMQNEGDREDWLEGLRHAAAQPEDPRLFVDDRLEPIVDPAAALARRTFPDDDAEAAADGIALNRRERDWLRGFLTCAQAPPDAMSLEEVDGFLTAIVLSRAAIPEQEWLDGIWDPPDGAEPVFGSAELKQFAIGLLRRHHHALLAQFAGNRFLDPLLDGYDLHARGMLWASAFLHGMGLRMQAWKPRIQDVEIGATAMAIIALRRPSPKEGEPEADDDSFYPPPSLADRGKTIASLPLLLRLIWSFDERPSPPARFRKVGRNERCPCGSGKKFKKCCGSGSTLH